MLWIQTGAAYRSSKSSLIPLGQLICLLSSKSMNQGITSWANELGLTALSTSFDYCDVTNAAVRFEPGAGYSKLYGELLTLSTSRNFIFRLLLFMFICQGVMVAKLGLLHKTDLFQGLILLYLIGKFSHCLGTVLTFNHYNLISIISNSIFTTYLQLQN